MLQEVGNMRVYELAKKLQVSSKEVLAFLATEKHIVSSHMAILSDEQTALVEKKFSKVSSTKKSDVEEQKQARLKDEAISDKVKKKHEVEFVEKQGQVKRSSGDREESQVDKKEADVVRERASIAVESVKQQVGPRQRHEAPKAQQTMKRRVDLVVDREREDDDVEGIDKSVLKFFQQGKIKLPGDLGITLGAPRRRKRRSANRHRAAQQDEVEQSKHVTEVTVDRSMPLFEVAEFLGKSTGELVTALLKKGMVCNRNYLLSEEDIKSLATHFGIDVLESSKQEDLSFLERKLEAAKGHNGVTRWPVVVVMGHVDHGKTTLLDYIRKMNVAAQEKGGITQHISAYEVESKHGKMVFLDTPGHEAFSYLRQHGARITDVAIIVIAADDGMKPQTLEAIRHAREAGVEIVVAINKIDKATTTAIEHVKRQLAEQDLLPEDWGGATVCVPISAKTGQGIDELLEMITLQTQLMDLKGYPENPARAYVLESRLEKGYGSVATVICTEGTIKPGDHFVCGHTTGKVRLLINARGERIKEAGPSMPVNIVGFNDFPPSGEWLRVVSAEEYLKARASLSKGISAANQEQQSMQLDPSMTLASFPSEKEQALKLVIKVDTRGSKEAIVRLMQKLMPLSKEVKCPLVIVSLHVGEVSENDVEVALNTGAQVIAFQVGAEKNAQLLAKEKGIEIQRYHVIYHFIEYLEKELEKRRKIEFVWKKVGEAVVRKVFPIKGGAEAIAGCYLREGTCTRKSKVACLRGNKVVGEGMITSLERDKKSVKEVNAGYEFGFLTDAFHGWQQDDVVHCFVQVEEKEAR